ncbi:site-specific DNA-methyltransferase [Chloroflexota bacterium]
MTDKQTVPIGEAKGRPMLHWVGKRPLDYVTAFPAQMVEAFNPADEQTDAQGLLFHGDNKDVLAWLLAHGYRGKVSLIYIDPPFDSGADYLRRVELRSVRTSQLIGDSYTLGEQIQYTDIWTNDNYFQFIYERMLLLKELLADDGVFWLHCDYHKSHYLKCICDEVLSGGSFITEVIWNRAAPRGNVKKGLSVAHDTLLVYGKGPSTKWHPVTLEYSDEYKERFNQIDPDGRRYTLDNMISPNPNRPNLDYEWKGVRRVWRVTKARMKELEAEGRLGYTAQGVARYKRYLDELEGQPLTTLWDDIFPVNSQASEREDYPTQKPEALVERIVMTSCDPGDLVFDCFVGSGTAAAVAQRLGRRWMAADINKGAIQTTSKRLQTIIREQIESGTQPQQGKLVPDDSNKGEPEPAALSFSVYRVNDYDLQVQHNEAVSLAVEHIGIQRTKTDVYFDGTLGKRLVKIVPFNHPLTLLDLQLLQDELKSRPDEERDIVLVCLGKETTVDPWVEDHNKRHPVNKIEVIELRTDQKYGKFFVHQPAQAQVKIERRDGNILVEIEDFLSPTIVERLEMDTPLFKAQIPDWRAMVDVVLIDTAYDGETFDITLSDVPGRKNDLVSGTYELPAPEGATTVAVKIVDMLGEEVLVKAEV